MAIMVNRIPPCLCIISLSSFRLISHKEIMELKISSLYPDVELISVKIEDTNAWPWNRLREFTYTPNTGTGFHLDCPMTKCLGKTRGIFFRDVISSMVSNHESHRKEKMECIGYGGYNLIFHCDWYAVLDISIAYRKS